MRRAVATALLVAGGLSCGRHRSIPSPSPERPLGQLIESLSEPAGSFDTDNLVSNETAYLQVDQQLETLVEPGGVYLGVGPEQNFNYIPRLKPSWAFIVDIRRQNMLQQLLLNDIVTRSEDPYHYLCRLLSRPCPARAPAPRYTDMDALLTAVRATPPAASALEATLQEAFEHIEGPLGLHLGDEDRTAIRNILRAFFAEQLEIRFRSFGPGFGAHHPTYETLLRAEDPRGYRHFLASPDDYRFVRNLVRSGRVIPVVGDFAGPTALKAVARFIRERGQAVSAFYLSNVEFYLFRQRSFDRFVANVRELPLTPGSVIIRACFDYGRGHPERLPGHRSTTLLQRIPRFLSLHDQEAYRGDWDVCTRDYLGVGSPR